MKELLQEALTRLEKDIKILGYCQRRFAYLGSVQDSDDLKEYLEECQKQLEWLIHACNELR